MRKYLLPGLLAFCLIFILCSCRNKGEWDDIIKLSVKSVQFSSGADSAVITTKGNWWWVDGVSVNGTNFLDFSDIDLESDNYTIREDCFTVKRSDAHTLFIKLEANPLSEKRIVNVWLEAGDYFDSVTITQLAN